MRIRRYVAVVLFVLLTMSGRSALGWSAGGHRVTARIAWGLLTNQEREVIAQIIRGNPRFDDDFELPSGVAERDEIEWLFTQASVWPDIIRNDPEFHRSTWHYINLPVYLTEDDRTALEETLPANLLTGLPADAENSNLNAIQAVKLSLAKLNDGGTTATERGVYICWLFHLVGDLQQPLHSSALFSDVAFPEGDRGGNRIHTNTNANLHSFWDGLLGGNIVLNTVRSRAVEITMNADLVALGEHSGEQLDPEAWAEEGNSICEEFVYSDAIRNAVRAVEDGTEDEVAVVDLSNDYKTEAGGIARERVAQGGYRLAALLKQVAAAQPAPPPGSTSNGLRIAALLPNPDNVEDRFGETIRLENSTPSTIDLSGWRVRDDDGDELLLSGEVAGTATIDIVDSKNDIPLANRGDTVMLINPSGDVVDQVDYDEDEVSPGAFIEFE